MFRALNRIFDYSGRSTRWEYWSFLIGFAVVLVAVGAWASGYQQSHDGLMPPTGSDPTIVIGLAALVLGLSSLSLKVRRYHDFGWSGWAVLWTFVPIVNVAMELMLLFRGPVPLPVAYAAEEPAPHVTIYNTPTARADDFGRAQPGHVDQIIRLADLHAQGALTAQEFAAAKARVLRS